jgi:hypothetical protein
MNTNSLTVAAAQARQAELRERGRGFGQPPARRPGAAADPVGRPSRATYNPLGLPLGVADFSRLVTGRLGARRPLR